MILVLLLCVSVLALGVTAQSRIRIKHALSCKEVENLALASEAQYYREQIERVVRPIEGPFRGFVLLPPAEEDDKPRPEPEASPPPLSLTSLSSREIEEVEWAKQREAAMARWRAVYKDYEEVSDRYILHLFEYPRNRPLQEEILEQMDAVGTRLAEMDKRLETMGISLDDLISSLSS